MVTEGPEVLLLLVRSLWPETPGQTAPLLKSSQVMSQQVFPTRR